MKEKANILIVDDNISLGKTMSFILRGKGYAATTAKDGPGAMEKVKRRSFEMIFMDIKMPLMNGVETYRRIKDIRPDAVVVMMTAYSVEDLVQEALEEGAYGIVHKPLDIEKVISFMERASKAKEGTLILVVDADPGACVKLENILTKRSYQVGVAHTGQEAITTAKEKAYEIIFIDMMLPTINGLETYLAIKKINPEAVAIMMTTYRQEMSDLVQQAMDKNAYACLYKPLDMEEVLRLVDKVRDRRQKAA